MGSLNVISVHCGLYGVISSHLIEVNLSNHKLHTQKMNPLKSEPLQMVVLHGLKKAFNYRMDYSMHYLLFPTLYVL